MREQKEFLFCLGSLWNACENNKRSVAIFLFSAAD